MPTMLSCASAGYATEYTRCPSVGGLTGLAAGLSQRATHIAVPAQTANSSQAPTASAVNGVGIRGGRTGSAPSARRPATATAQCSSPTAYTSSTSTLNPSRTPGMICGSVVRLGGWAQASTAAAA